MIAMEDNREAESLGPMGLVSLAALVKELGAPHVVLRTILIERGLPSLQVGPGRQTFLTRADAATLAARYRERHSPEALKRAKPQ